MTKRCGAHFKWLGRVQVSTAAQAEQCAKVGYEPTTWLKGLGAPILTNIQDIPPASCIQTQEARKAYVGCKINLISHDII